MTYPENLFEGYCVSDTLINKQITFMQCVGIVLFVSLLAAMCV